MSKVSPLPLHEVWTHLAEVARSRPYVSDEWNDYAENQAAPYLDWLAKAAPVRVASVHLIAPVLGDLVMTSDGSPESFQQLAMVIGALEQDLGVPVGTSKLTKQVLRVVEKVQKYPPAKQPSSQPLVRQQVDQAPAPAEEPPPVWRDSSQPPPPSSRSDERPPVDVSLLSGPVVKIRQELTTGHYDDHLEALAAAEREGKGRTTVLEAIAVRRERIAS